MAFPIPTPQRIDRGGIIVIVEGHPECPSSKCPDILAPIFNKFGIVLRRQLHLVGKKMDEELCASYLKLCLKIGESPT
jgi:hypothetical protein